MGSGPLWYHFSRHDKPIETASQSQSQQPGRQPPRMRRSERLVVGDHVSLSVPGANLFGFGRGNLAHIDQVLLVLATRRPSVHAPS